MTKMDYAEIAKKINEMNMMANVILDEKYKDDWTPDVLETELDELKEEIRKGTDLTCGCQTGGIDISYIEGELIISTCHDIARMPFKIKKVKK